MLRPVPKIVRLNKRYCFQGLNKLKKVFDSNKIPFMLGYGTLLGAVREEDFIGNSGDVDLILFKKHQNKVYRLLKPFSPKRQEDYVTFSFKNNKFDLYFISQRNRLDEVLERYTWKHGWRVCFIERKFVEQDKDVVKIKGREFFGLSDSVGWLDKTYVDWRTPKNVKGNTWVLSSKVYYFFKYYLKRKRRELIRGLK